MTPPLATAMRSALRAVSIREIQGRISAMDLPSRSHVTDVRGGAADREPSRELPPRSEASEVTTEFRAHDLRHRRVTTWLAEAKSATLVKEAVGHADLRTTML